MLKCRVCETGVSKFTTYGSMPIANGFLKPENYGSEYFFELAPAFCGECKMLQIIEQPDPEKMFHENYAFFSSTSKHMAAHFEEMANHYKAEYIPDSSDAFVVELGSNDGIMLRHFAKDGIKHLGVEPSSNVAEEARKVGVNCVSKFFGAETAAEVKAEYGQADIISAANVMCHIPDLHSVARGVDALLKDKGIFVFEDPYLGAMVEKTSYDQIYDEHVYIFSVLSVANMFGRYGLEVFRVAPQTTHGGSMRYYLCRKGAHPIHESVAKQLEVEKSLGLDKATTFDAFAAKCEKSKNDLVELLKNLKAEGKTVAGYAATSKSTTVLNYCGIGPDLIDYISDTTPLKQGKYSPGMHIPIKPYEDFKADYPDYAVLFAWNHAKEIMEKEQDFIARGGKWITFVPEVKVISNEQELKNAS